MRRSSSSETDSPRRLLEELRARGIALEVDGDTILARPRSAITRELAERIRAAKPVLLELLRAEAQQDGGSVDPGAAVEAWLRAREELDRAYMWWLETCSLEAARRYRELWRRLYSRPARCMACGRVSAGGSADAIMCASCVLKLIGSGAKERKLQGYVPAAFREKRGEEPGKPREEVCG